MEIIPIHYTRSNDVTHWLAIEDEAKQLCDFMDSYDRQGLYALHHSQVSAVPFNFFVLNEKVLDLVVKDLGGRVIVNPKVLEFDPESVYAMKEGCASFPHRIPKYVSRAMKVKVSYDIHDPMVSSGLTHHEKEVERIIAQIFQHECDHAVGKNLFFKGPKK